MITYTIADTDTIATVVGTHVPADAVVDAIRAYQGEMMWGRFSDGLRYVHRALTGDLEEAASEELALWNFTITAD